MVGLRGRFYRIDHANRDCESFEPVEATAQRDDNRWTASEQSPGRKSSMDRRWFRWADDES
ncbi:hypothetical protein CFAM422_002026 [Trichoderma lentiforme]|uniref:Uncharacterized protein n=1 Tax=Trichoderma lentiforme TaxID=1567552 RepID=A0A9P4XNL2_9HYPO|nr:hypothetical protein CFAM422_002026 [Trichoderma lentiforme]